jgi:hypothetical protein
MAKYVLNAYNSGQKIDEIARMHLPGLSFKITGKTKSQFGDHFVGIVIETASPLSSRDQAIFKLNPA